MFLILGAYFLINYDPQSFNSLKLDEVFKKDITKIKLAYKNYQLLFHTSKLLNGKFQVVLASDTKYADEMNEIAKTIHSIFTSCKYKNIIRY